MASKKKSNKISPVVQATAVDPTPPTTTNMAAPAPVVKMDPPAATKPEPTPTPDEEEAHFDVAQNVYGTIKNIWAWGTTVPVITNILGLTEAVAAKVLDTTLHTDLPAIDQNAMVPNLKKLDHDVVNPVILAVWKIIEPAIHKSEEMIVKPIMKEVVPRVLAPLSMFDNDKKKKDLEAKKAEEKKAMIDSSPTPEIVPALN